MIGIVSKYLKRDSTQYMLSLSNRFDRLGCKHVILPDGKHSKLHLYTDKLVSKEPFVKLIKKFSNVFWGLAPDINFLHEANKRKINNTFIADLDEIEPFDEESFGAFDLIVLPSQTQMTLIKSRYKINNVKLLPYTPDLPITKKIKQDSEHIKLFISLYGSQLVRVELMFLYILADIVKNNKNVSLTIGCDRGFSPRAYKDCKMFAALFKDRWKFLYNCSWDDQVIEIGKSDLTVFPPLWDTCGIIPITSLYMGTPVISWDIAPINEYLSSERNAILVRCNTAKNWLGAPTIEEADYDEFEKQLKWIIGKPKVLTELHKHTHEGLDNKRSDFNRLLNSIIPAV